MNKLLLVGLTCTSLLVALPEKGYCHGGQYRGPGDVVPPNPGGGRSTGGPSGPTTGGPAGPSTPGPSGPATPGPSGPATGGPAGPAAAKGPTTGGRGVVLDDDLTRWEFWWEFNKDPYIRLKDAIHSGGIQTGSDDFFLGHTRKPESSDTLKPSNEDVLNSILPALKKALDSTDNRDIASSCMVAMAKIGKDHPDFMLLDKVFAPHLTSKDQEIREVAALSIGIAGLTGKAGESVNTLIDLALDKPEGRAKTARSDVDDRTRTFATYGLGLIAFANGNIDVKRTVFTALQQILNDEKLSKSRNIRVAALNAVKLLNLSGQSSEEKTLLEDAIVLLKNYYIKEVGAGDQAIIAHCPTAIAKLLGRDHEKSAEFKEMFARDLEGKNKKHTQNEIFESCALALGQMVKPVDDDKSKDKDAEYCKILLDQAKNNKDAQTKYFCWLALGQIGGKANHDLLVKEFDNSKGQPRSWIAMAMGIQTFHKNDLLRKENSMPEPDRAFGEALKNSLDEKTDQVLAAEAVALGLMQYKDTADAVRQLLVKNSNKEELAGYLCIALALMDDKHSIEDIKAIVAKSVRRPELLKQAAIALGKLGDKTIADELLKLLTDGEKNLAKLSAIASALGFIGDRRTIEPLKTLLFDTQLTELSRAFAAVALGGVADKEKLPWNSKIGVNLNYRASVETLTDKGNATGILDIL